MKPEETTVPKVDISQLKMPEKAVVPTHKQSPLTLLIIGLMVAVLIVLMAGLYLWGTSLMDNTPVVTTARPTAEENAEPESTTAEARTDTTNIVSTSDELDAIEADLEATQFSDLDADFIAIDAEFETQN